MWSPAKTTSLFPSARLVGSDLSDPVVEPSRVGVAAPRNDADCLAEPAWQRWKHHIDIPGPAVSCLVAHRRTAAYQQVDPPRPRRLSSACLRIKLGEQFIESFGVKAVSRVTPTSHRSPRLQNSCLEPDPMTAR